MANPQTDIAILGGGVFGLCAALACVEAGLSVRLYEKRRIGAGASGGLLGVMSPYAPDTWNPKKAFQLDALLSAEPFWRAIAERTGQDPGYARTGRLVPIHDEKGRARMADHIAGAVFNWRGQARVWHQDTHPHLTVPAHGFAADSLSGRINPRQAVAALAALLRQLGVEIVENARLTLPQASATAGQVVVAAGHESARLLGTEDLMTKGVKGQAALLDTQLPDDLPVVSGQGFYLASHPGLGVAVGSTSERDWVDATSIDSQLDDLIARARGLAPTLHDAPVRLKWAGVRPRGQRPDPVIGAVPGMDRTWLLSGGYGIGFGIAHEIGRAMAALVQGKAVDLPDGFHVEAHLAKARARALSQ